MSTLKVSRFAENLLAILMIFGSGLADAASPTKSAAGAVRGDAQHPCRAVHTFDFWIGEFEARPWNQWSAPATGHLNNTVEYEGCVIVERWTGANSVNGMSMSFYDVSRHAWRMVWVADSGQSNDLEGSYSDGAMRFRGWVLDSAGKRLLASNVLKNVSRDTIRHIYSTSSNGGKTWVVKSDGRFVRTNH